MVRCNHCHLQGGIGSATASDVFSDEFAATLEGKVPYEKVGTLERATDAAARAAEASRLEDAVVLLSPACASFDQYRNFEVRGDAFRALVKAIPGLAPIARK